MPPSQLSVGLVPNFQQGQYVKHGQQGCVNRGGGGEQDDNMHMNGDVCACMRELHETNLRKVVFAQICDAANI